MFRCHWLRSIAVLALGLAAALPLAARERDPEAPFQLNASTMPMPAACDGKLELNLNDMVFACPNGTVTIPYSSIRLMEYRPDMSKQVRKMKLRWKVRPNLAEPLFGKKENRYFTVVFGEKAPYQALILDVEPDTMRPYLAEIDLKAGRRVVVWGYAD